MKTYIIDVRYYINVENEEELQDQLREMGISSNEYYGGYDIVDVEETDVEELEL